MNDLQHPNETRLGCHTLQRLFVLVLNRFGCSAMLCGMMCVMCPCPYISLMSLGNKDAVKQNLSYESLILSRYLPAF